MAFPEVKVITSNPKQIPAIEKEVESRLKSIIQNFHEWEDRGETQDCPIRWSEKSVKGLRKYADQCIAKGSLKKKDDYAREQFITAATEARASAYRREWMENRGAREQRALEESKVRTERARYEAALKPNGARISKLQKIVKDAAVAEQSLAQIFRALKAHEAAATAREELRQIKVAGENAALALNTTAPKVDIPMSDYVKDAVDLASIFHRALNAMPREYRDA